MSLAKLLPRIQRFRMRLMRTFHIVHVPGKDHTTADTLSTVPLLYQPLDGEIEREEIKAYVFSVARDLPATAYRLNDL